jgi:nucleotide-binding universal stress UspA family protein
MIAFAMDVQKPDNGIRRRGIRRMSDDTSIPIVASIIDGSDDARSISPIFSAERNTGRRRTILYKNILIPTDGSELAAKAVEQDVLFAKEIGAKITAMTVTEPFHLLSVAPSQLEYTPIEYKKRAEAYAEKVLGIVSAAAKLAGVGCETLHVEHEQHVYQAIIDAAASRRCDLILMASHGRRGVSAVVLGSETVKVLTHSKIPVLVYR